MLYAILLILIRCFTLFLSGHYGMAAGAFPASMLLFLAERNGRGVSACIIRPIRLLQWPVNCRRSITLKRHFRLSPRVKGRTYHFILAH